MTQKLLKQQKDGFTTGMLRADSLLEGYTPRDEDQFRRTHALVESGNLTIALHEHTTRLAEDMVTDDLPIILAGNANLHFREGLLAIEHPWRDVWNVESYRNFQTQNIADLNETLETDDEGGALAENDLLPVVPEHHGFNDMRVSEHYEQMQLVTYGGTFTLSRQMLVNDNLRVLNGIPASMGRTAALTLTTHAQVILEDNPDMVDGTALFHADHDNLVTTTPFTLANLQEQYGLFGAQELPSGRAHHLKPRDLIVPQALALEADRLVSALSQVLITQDMAAAANLSIPDRNVMAGRLRVVVFPELANDDDWYLAGDPARIGTIEVGFLNGQQEPELFMQEPNADLSAADGTRYKVREDFDVYPVNWAGLRKMDSA